MLSIIDTIGCILMVFVLCAAPIVATLGVLAIVHLDAKDKARAARREQIEVMRRYIEARERYSRRA